MKLALHRSITFWSGVLVMGFVGWAAWISYRSQFSISHRRFLLFHAHGGLELRWLHEGFYNSQFQTGAYQEYPRDFFRTATFRDIPTDRITVFVPHWIILLVVAVPWLALLFWRARRRKRARSAHTF